MRIQGFLFSCTLTGAAGLLLWIFPALEIPAQQQNPPPPKNAPPATSSLQVQIDELNAVLKKLQEAQKNTQQVYQAQQQGTDSSPNPEQKVPSLLEQEKRLIETKLQRGLHLTESHTQPLPPIDSRVQPIPPQDSSPLPSVVPLPKISNTSPSPSLQNSASSSGPPSPVSVQNPPNLPGFAPSSPLSETSNTRNVGRSNSSSETSLPENVGSLMEQARRANTAVRQKDVSSLINKLTKKDMTFKLADILWTHIFPLMKSLDEHYGCFDDLLSHLKSQTKESRAKECFVSIISQKCFEQETCVDQCFDSVLADDIKTRKSKGTLSPLFQSFFYGPSILCKMAALYTTDLGSILAEFDHDQWWEEVGHRADPYLLPSFENELEHLTRVIKESESWDSHALHQGDSPACPFLHDAILKPTSPLSEKEKGSLFIALSGQCSHTLVQFFTPSQRDQLNGYHPEGQGDKTIYGEYGEALSFLFRQLVAYLKKSPPLNVQKQLDQQGKPTYFSDQLPSENDIVEAFNLYHCAEAQGETPFLHCPSQASQTLWQCLSIKFAHSGGKSFVSSALGLSNISNSQNVMGQFQNITAEMAKKLRELTTLEHLDFLTKLSDIDLIQAMTHLSDQDIARFSFSNLTKPQAKQAQKDLLDLLSHLTSLYTPLSHNDLQSRYWYLGGQVFEEKWALYQEIVQKMKNDVLGSQEMCSLNEQETCTACLSSMAGLLRGDLYRIDPEKAKALEQTLFDSTHTWNQYQEIVERYPLQDSYYTLYDNLNFLNKAYDYYKGKLGSKKGIGNIANLSSSKSTLDKEKYLEMLSGLGTFWSYFYYFLVQAQCLLSKPGDTKSPFDSLQMFYNYFLYHTFPILVSSIPPPFDSLDKFKKAFENRKTQEWILSGKYDADKKQWIIPGLVGNSIPAGYSLSFFVNGMGLDTSLLDLYCFTAPEGAESCMKNPYFLHVVDTNFTVDMIWGNTQFNITLPDAIFNRAPRDNLLTYIQRVAGTTKQKVLDVLFDPSIAHALDDVQATEYINEDGTISKNFTSQTVNVRTLIIPQYELQPIDQFLDRFQKEVIPAGAATNGTYTQLLHITRLSINLPQLQKVQEALRHQLEQGKPFDPDYFFTHWDIKMCSQ